MCCRSGAAKGGCNASLGASVFGRVLPVPTYTLRFPGFPADTRGRRACRWGGGQRTLQRWEPAPGEESLEELESSTTYEPGWNQFELNEAKFGVHSTWDEVRSACVSKSLPHEL